MNNSRRRFAIDQRSLSVVYVIALVVVIFGVWIPDRFLTSDTLASILNNSAISGIVALSLLLPLAAGLYDFSIGYTVGVTSVLVAWLLGNTGLGVVGSIAVALLAGALIGVVNGVVVVVFKINSFIGTLATGSLLVAVNLIVSGNQILTKGVMEEGFVNISQATIGRFTLPVVYFVVIAALVWYLLAHTAVGRRIYATGLSIDAARLAGIRTARIQFGALVASASLSGLAGVLVAAQIGAGSPDVGPPFLIPAFAAAFLGLAQSRLGLFNPWGTVAAVVLLATTSGGLALAGAPLWAPYVFTGGVLIAAIGLSGLITGHSGRAAQSDLPTENDHESVTSDREPAAAAHRS